MFFSRRTVPQRALFIRKALRREFFFWRRRFKVDGISTAERQPSYPTKLTQRTVAERTIDIEDGRVMIGRAVVRRAVSIRTSSMKGWFKNILHVHKRNE